MASALLPTDYECPVCHENFVDPKLLPCMHRVCKQCLLSWLQAEGEGGCPLCRAPVLPDSTLRTAESDDVSNLVEKLPTDLATMAVVESHKALSGSDVCALCDLDLVATSFCLDCNAKVCKSCVKYHKRIPALREHRVEDLGTVTSERVAASHRHPCDLHPEKPAELYCWQHHTLICLLCATAKHRNCGGRGVEGLEDVATRERPTLRDQTERLRQLASHIESQIRQVDQELADVQTHFKATKAEVKATFERLQQSLEKRQQQIMADVEKEEDRLLKELQGNKRSLDQHRSAVMSQVRAMDQLLANSPDSALVGMLHQLQERLDSLEKQPREETAKKGRELVTVLLDSEKLDSLHRDIAVLGQVNRGGGAGEKRSTQQTRQDCSGPQHQGSSQSHQAPGINPLMATPRRTFFMDNQQLRVPGDEKRPWITCLAVTGGGRVVMADYNNQSVKVLDAGSPASISALSLGVKPSSLAVCHDGLAAVTSLSDNVIRLIDVTGTPRVVQQIKTVRQYRGVGCGGVDDTLLVSCRKDEDGPAHLDVITRKGTVVRTVVDSSTLSGLKSPDYLCVVGGQVLLSDFDFGANCVWRVDVATGSLLAKHTHQEIKFPYQVTADRAGNMYVASGRGHCVLVMGRDGQWRTLLRGEEHGEGRYVWPWCVALTGTRLFVEWSGGGQSVLLGYELA